MELFPVFHGIIFHVKLEFIPHLVEYSNIPSGAQWNGMDWTSKYIGFNTFSKPMKENLFMFSLGSESAKVELLNTGSLSQKSLAGPSRR